MRKKLLSIGNSLGLVIERPILELILEPRPMKYKDGTPKDHFAGRGCIGGTELKRYMDAFMGR